MKYSVIAVLATVLAVALAAPQGPRQGAVDDSQTQIVRFVNNNNAIDSYHFGYDWILICGLPN